MNGFDKVKEKMDNILLQETCPRQVLFMGMMNESPVSSKEPKEVEALFLQGAETNAAYFGKFRPRYFVYIGPGSEKTWNFEKYPDNPKGKWDELAKQVTDVHLVQKHPILKGCINFQKGELKKGGENTHFSARGPSIKMIMDLISSANDFCIVFGICDFPGKLNEI